MKYRSSVDQFISVENQRGERSVFNTARRQWPDLCFVFVTDRQKLQELGRLVRTGPYTAQAAAAIVVGAERDNPLAVSDVSRAIQSMILAAWAEGVGSNWTGFTGHDDVRDLVGLPDSFNVIAVLPLGYPKRKLGKGLKNRKPANEVYSAEKFGNPL